LTPRSYNVEINSGSYHDQKERNSKIIARGRRENKYKTVKCLLMSMTKLEKIKILIIKLMKKLGSLQ